MTAADRRAVIVGAAESDLGHTPTLSAADLMAQASVRALEDAGLRTGEVDGLLATNPYHWMPSLTLGEYLGIAPRYTDSTTVGGASFLVHLEHAILAVEAGRCDVALIAYGSNQRSHGGYTTRSEWPAFEYFAGPIFPMSAYAMAAQRHRHVYGTTPEQLAEVAVAARQWALLNPNALTYGRGPLTVADVLGSPMVSSPLHRLDCCLVTDGGGAVVVTTEERARDLPGRPVYVHGLASTHTFRHMSQMPDFTSTAATITGPRALAQAGARHADLDFVQLYDAFTINVVLVLEDLGFCARGEGGAFVSGGRIAPGGAFPLNTSGGGLSYTHPGMFGIFLLIEAVRQLRGECGARQVPGARLGLVHGIGGVFSSAVTAILGREPAG